MKKGPILRFGHVRPEPGSRLIVRPMALVVIHPSEALANFRISERELVAQAHPACDQRPAFGAVWRHLAIERALKISVPSLPSRTAVCVLSRRQGCPPQPKRLSGLRTVVLLRPICGFLHLYLLQDGLVEKPLRFRRVLCAPLCMFNGPQDAIQTFAPLTQRRPLPRKRDRQPFCATANWGV